MKIKKILSLSIVIAFSLTGCSETSVKLEEINDYNSEDIVSINYSQGPKQSFAVDMSESYFPDFYNIINVVYIDFDGDTSENSKLTENAGYVYSIIFTSHRYLNVTQLENEKLLLFTYDNYYVSCDKISIPPKYKIMP